MFVLLCSRCLFVCALWFCVVCKLLVVICYVYSYGLCVCLFCVVVWVLFGLVIWIVIYVGYISACLRNFTCCFYDLD